MLRSSFLLAVSQLVFVLASAVHASQSYAFENTAVVRQVSLGGSAVHVKTTYTVRSLSKNNAVYTISIPKLQDERTSWIEAKVAGGSKPLSVGKHGIEALLALNQPVVYYSITLPRTLGANDTIVLAVDTIESHATYPLPPTLKQSETQSLVYETVALVTSPYPTVNQRTKIRSETPQIHSFSEPKSLQRFAAGEVATKAGSVVTYGPFMDLPASDSPLFAETVQEAIKIHFEYNHPILTLSTLRRVAEISHWGANLNIQDDIHIRNDAAALGGHFSRLEFQTKTYYQKPTGHNLRGLSISLPGNARDVYYTDIIGNVSTSRFAPAPPRSRTRSASERTSTLEMRPRYPLLGGWNYTFTLGWDAPLDESATFDKATGEYIVAIPFFTSIPSAVVDDAEVKIVLPEGATNLAIHTPFAVDSITRSTHITYLDTTGRPAITLGKKNLTERHSDLIYVTYSLSSVAHLSKVAAVTTASLVVLTLMYVLRRIDFRITTKT